MEESVSNFLYYYIGSKHSTTGVTQFEVMRNMDDKDMKEKVKERKGLKSPEIRLKGPSNTFREKILLEYPITSKSLKILTMSC